MTQHQAVAIAFAACPQFEVPDSCSFTGAEKRIIEIVAHGGPVRDEAPPPGPVLDRVAWVVTFGLEAWSAEFAVDDQTGAILRFRRSRGSPREG